MLSMVVVGHRCRLYRKRILKTELKTIALDLGYSVENISAFEHGRNDNSIILLWYLIHGMSLDMLMGVVVIE